MADTNQKTQNKPQADPQAAKTEDKSEAKQEAKALKVKNPTKNAIRITGKAGAIAIIGPGEERQLTTAFEEAAREEKALDLV